MLEIEQKFVASDFPSLRARLEGLGAKGPERHTESDRYFNGPDRDFARTGEAFRLRSVGERNMYTFKGPKRQGPVKVRRELEIDLPPGEEAASRHAELLGMLGYRYVATVTKTRDNYSLAWKGREFTVCLDDAEKVGTFAEVELLAEESEANAAAAAVAELARELGLTRHEPRSYLTMLLQITAKEQARQPLVVRTVPELRAAVAEARRQGKSVGFVPTMGALHAGHRSLIEASRSRDECVVVSIFVNPAQFAPQEDLSRYPRPFEADLALCAAAGTDIIFHPAPEVVYPPDFRTWCEVTGLQDVLEGASRPGHFRGVATVVLKLFNMAGPDRAYFGQKDGQQVRIIQQMVKDLDVPVEVVVLPTVREQDGLALSSRNVYLDPTQRAASFVLSWALSQAEAAFRSGEHDAAALTALMADAIAATPGAALDYAAVVDADTLLPAGRVEAPAMAALAVRFGATRLIDNIILRP
jgi:pantoate--beta-alanine ligase